MATFEPCKFNQFHSFQFLLGNLLDSTDSLFPFFVLLNVNFAPNNYIEVKISITCPTNISIVSVTKKEKMQKKCKKSPKNPKKVRN